MFGSNTDMYVESYCSMTNTEAVRYSSYWTLLHTRSHDSSAIGVYIVSVVTIAKRTISGLREPARSRDQRSLVITEIFDFRTTPSLETFDF